MRRITRTLSALVFVALLCGVQRAQQPSVTQQTRDNRIALYQALLDLANPWTVMCVAAHPDDEDGTSLIVMRRKYGAHTISLFSTFGEGGQNAIGPELYEELGAIRARETMAASEIQGSEPYFLGLRDFGFSKSRDETFQKWGQEEALRRMVLHIRRLRPDVIITNHSTTSNDHGHHQATARLVVEAFDTAADPTKFPDQLKDGVTTWQVQRLFVRVRGNQPVQNPDRQGGGQQIVTIDPNERDPVRGTLFAEQALSALQKHATQGPWPKTFAEFTARFRAFSGQSGAAGRMPLIRYRLEREAKGADALPKDSRNFVEGLKLLPTVASRVQPPSVDGRPLKDFIDDRALVARELSRLQAQITAELQNTDPALTAAALKNLDVHVQQFQWALQSALAAANGIEATLRPNTSVVPGRPAKFTLNVANNGTKEARVKLTLFGIQHAVRETQFSTSPSGRPMSVVVRPGTTAKIQIDYSMPANAELTVPHSAHLAEGIGPGRRFVAGAMVSNGNSDFSLITSAMIDVAPPLEIAEISPAPLVIMGPRVGVSSAGADIIPPTPPKVTVKLVNHMKRSFKGEVAFGFENRSPETRVRVDLLPEQTSTLTVTIPNTEQNRTAHMRRPELANSLWFSLRHAGLHENLIKRSVPVVWLDARVAGSISVGYIRGFDFSLPNALNALAVESKELTVDEVKTGDLSKYTSIIVDNRVYESQPELIAANQKLLDYAQAGGNLIVFYHRIDEFNPNPQRNRPQLAPYKLILGNERITDENAPISFIEPDHPLLNSPNKLNQDDFKDWIQERGLYYPREWDPQFKALLQSNDPGEQPLKGGLLVADYGKGHYIYTSMVWYRQLRAGVPGAYRMLANMISYGRN
jgi:LmbE family N-acetylglucosaminyl deacetylase